MESRLLGHAPSLTVMWSPIATQVRLESLAYHFRTCPEVLGTIQPLVVEHKTDFNTRHGVI